MAFVGEENERRVTLMVRNSDGQKCALVYEISSFEWYRMPLRLCNRSATFQRIIAQALQKIFNLEGSMGMA